MSPNAEARGERSFPLVDSVDHSLPACVHRGALCHAYLERGRLPPSQMPLILVPKIALCGHSAFGIGLIKDDFVPSPGLPDSDFMRVNRSGSNHHAVPRPASDPQVVRHNTQSGLMMRLAEGDRDPKQSAH